MREHRKKPKNRDQVKEQQQPQHINPSQEKPIHQHQKHPYNNHKHPSDGCGCS